MPGDHLLDDDFDLDAALGIDDDFDEASDDESSTATRKIPLPTRVSFRPKADVPPSDEWLIDGLDGLDDIPEFGLESGQFRAFGVEISSGEFELELDTNPWAGFTGSARSPSLHDRAEEVGVVLDMLRSIAHKSKHLARLTRELSELSARLETEDQTDRELSELSARLETEDQTDLDIESELAKALESIEARTVRAERKVPGSLLRRHIDSGEFDSASLAHYLRFQLEHLDATPECWSRIDLVVTRVTRRQIRDDYYLPKEPTELIDLWNQILPPSTTSSEVRNTAVSFFADAAARLEEFTDAEDLFTTGFYVDLAGYKISLRLHYFDPVILFAAAKTNIALHNWLAAQESTGRNLDALGTHFAEAHNQIRAIFTRQDKDFEAIARFRERMFGKPPEPEPEPEPEPDWGDPLKSFSPKLIKRLAIAAVVLVAIGVAGHTALQAWTIDKRDLTELDSSTTRSIHPLLTSASIGGDPADLLVGEIDSSEWLVLSQDEKRAELRVLRSGMRAHGVKSALIYRDGTVAIHIVDGTLRVLE